MNKSDNRPGLKLFWIAISLSLITFAVGVGYVIYLAIAYPPSLGH